MGQKLAVHLTPETRSSLESGYRNGHCHCFRQRCRIILLKADGLSSKDIMPVVGMETPGQINVWVHRFNNFYHNLGINCLLNKPGQGRKSILNIKTDVEKVRKAVTAERQRISVAKDVLEKELGKTLSTKTLKRFLKNLTADSNELGAL